MSDVMAFTLLHDAFGGLTLIDANGIHHENVVPVRAHPITAPLEGVSILSQDGHEFAWIPHLDLLAPAARAMLDEALAGREFMPEIERLVRVSSFATPSTWTVLTNRGETSFVLKGEEDIRRVGGGTLMIADSHGIHFLIRDSSRLDSHSRRILDRFL